MWDLELMAWRTVATIPGRRDERKKPIRFVEMAEPVALWFAPVASFVL